MGGAREATGSGFADASSGPGVAGWSRPHLLGCAGLSADELRSILTRAERYEPIATMDAPRGEDDRHAQHAACEVLRGRTVVNLFFEDSTRTRVSFALAARRLGAQVVDLTLAGSSLSKGETLIDTAKNIEAMGASAFVVRAGTSGSPAMLARAIDRPVINAGDGSHEHPTQALLDIFTLTAAIDRRGAYDLAGLTVAIVGDVVSSRVARSNAAAMTALGADVVLVGPPALAPGSLTHLAHEGSPGRVRVAHDFDAVLGEADAVMMLRMQFERHKSPAIASAREYRLGYGLTAARASRLRERAVVMHPGPMNRGFEIDSEVADGARSLVMRQAAAGVAVRMAVLEACVGASERAHG
ncbi:MAG: aspartate carbamoyltransferase catalytic subunit [Phycisphaerales bacterium]|nr:MAG: aspartate carbamoyltransferase catalytic subunit [Phycisphaerales bacterium]